MFSLLKKIPVFIYDLFISTFLTISAHLNMMEHMTLDSGNFLDVGCGTGMPLNAILPTLSDKYSRIVGVDLHHEYTNQAKQLFRNNPKVEIFESDFYEVKECTKDVKFETIFFSFSFMLMPDQVKALLLAKSLLKSKGKVCFLMTLNKKPIHILEKIKPIIKKLTTVDFGKVTYEHDLEEIIGICQMKITKKQRVTSKWNPLLRIFPVTYIECQAQENSSQ